MDIFIEFILEIILEGCIMAPFEKKVPFYIRLICGIIVSTVYLWIIGVFVYLAISHKNNILFLIAVFVAVIVLYAFRKNIKK